MPLSREVLTTRQAADLLGLSTTSVQKLVLAGELEAWVTSGGHRRVFRDSVEKLALVRSTAAAADAARSLRVLVADADTAHVQQMRELLSNCDPPVELTVASDAVQALILLERLRPDLVLTDLVLEPFDGIHLIKALAADPAYQGIRVVVVTALSAAQRAAAKPLPDWVTVYPKPLAQQRLLGYLDAVQSRLQRAPSPLAQRQG